MPSNIVRVPDIGDFSDVPVIELFVKAGDSIKVDDAICTLESDKATMDVPSTASGVIQEVLVKLGDKVSEGSVLIKVDAAGAAAAAPNPAAPGGAVEVRVPDIGDFSDVPVIELLVKAGDSIKVDDDICTLESDKATMDLPSTASGVIQEVLVKLGDKVSEGTVLIKVAAAAPKCAADAVAGADGTVGIKVPDSGARVSEETPSIRVNVPCTPSVAQSIFISYRREDSVDICGRIYDRLQSHFSMNRVFKDVDSIPIGVDFRKHLSSAVGNCSILLVVIGRNWLEAKNDRGLRRLDDPRDFVRIEIEAALQRDIPVVPVLVQGAAVPLDSELPSSIESLAFRHGAPVRADPDFHTDLDRLIRGIEQHFGTKTA